MDRPRERIGWGSYDPIVGAKQMRANDRPTGIGLFTYKARLKPRLCKAAPGSGRKLILKGTSAQVDVLKGTGFSPHIISAKSAGL
jgi:hypothetical protein